MNNKSYGYGAESDKRTPYFAYRQILNDLFYVLNQKYFLTGRLEVLVNEMRLKYPELFGSKEKLSSSRSNSFLYDKNSDNGTSRSNSMLYGEYDDYNANAIFTTTKKTSSKGAYRDMLSLFFKKSDPVLRVFDCNFPGFWSAAGANIAVPQGDQKIILSVFLTNFLNFCTASDIRIHITLDDFQVSKKILSSKTEF